MHNQGEIQEFQLWLQNIDETLNYTNIFNIILYNPGWLQDDCLDAFILVVQDKKPELNIQSVNFQKFPPLVNPIVSGEGVAIIGGTCTNHWRVARCKNNIIQIYDSLRSCTNGKLVK